MALRILRLVNHWFALAAFWGYLAAVAIAFTMVIVFFPVGALIMLFGGLLALPLVVAISTCMGWWERAWCRRWLQRSRCPNCLETGAVEVADTTARRVTPDGGGAAPDDDSPFRDSESPRYECRRCGACFAESGAGVESFLAA